jgi:hypothetical protein
VDRNGQSKIMQSCGSGFIESRFIESGSGFGSGNSSESEWIRIQDFDDEKLKKKTAEIFLIIFF